MSMKDDVLTAWSNSSCLEDILRRDVKYRLLDPGESASTKGNPYVTFFVGFYSNEN